MLSVFTNEYTVTSLKKEVRNKMAVYGPEISKPINTKKTKKTLPSKKETINSKIIKNNSYIGKELTIIDLYLVEIKESKIVFRTFDGQRVEYTFDKDKKPSFEKGVKYKVTGKLLMYSDILIFEYKNNTRVY